MSFYQYFLATLDKHGIKLTKGYDHDSHSKEWTRPETIIQDGKDIHSGSPGNKVA